MVTIYTTIIFSNKIKLFTNEVFVFQMIISVASH
jgi:hypothetical protein